MVRRGHGVLVRGAGERLLPGAIELAITWLGGYVGET